MVGCIISGCIIPTKMKLQEIKSLIMGKPKQERWIGINEASKYAGCSSQTLRRNIKSQKLKASSTTDISVRCFSVLLIYCD